MPCSAVHVLAAVARRDAASAQLHSLVVNDPASAAPRVVWSPVWLLAWHKSFWASNVVCTRCTGFPYPAEVPTASSSPDEGAQECQNGQDLVATRVFVVSRCSQICTDV